MFDCRKECGACCRSISKSDITKHLDRGDGVCINYEDETYMCKIYETRPFFCRVDSIYDGYFSTIPLELFYEKTHEACDELRELLK